MRPIILLIICTFFWGSCYPITKILLREINAPTLIFWRFLIASVCLLIYMKIIKLSFPYLSFQKWFLIIFISTLGIGGFNIIVFTGLSYTNATNGSLIMALSPLVTSLITCIAMRILPSIIQCISLAISFLGVLMVITNGHINNLLSIQINYGDQLIFFGMFIWSIYTYFSQRISKWIQGVSYTLVGTLSGAILTGIICLVSPNIHSMLNVNSISVLNLFEILYLSIFGTVVSYLFWLNGISHLGSMNASVFFNFVPIFSLLISYMLGQPITQIQLMGITIVIIGLLLPHIFFKYKTKI